MENALLLVTDLNNHKIQMDASMEKKWYQSEAKIVLLRQGILIFP